MSDVSVMFRFLCWRFFRCFICLIYKQQMLQSPDSNTSICASAVTLASSLGRPPVERTQTKRTKSSQEHLIQRSLSSKSGPETIDLCFLVISPLYAHAAKMNDLTTTSLLSWRKKSRWQRHRYVEEAWFKWGLLPVEPQRWPFCTWTVCCRLAGGRRRKKNSNASASPRKPAKQQGGITSMRGIKRKDHMCLQYFLSRPHFRIGSLYVGFAQ